MQVNINCWLFVNSANLHERIMFFVFLFFQFNLAFNIYQLGRKGVRAITIIFLGHFPASVLRAF